MIEADKKQIGMKTGTMLALFFVVYGLLGAFLGYLVNMVNPDFHWAYGILIMLVAGAIVVLATMSAVKSEIAKMKDLAAQQKGRYPKLESMVEDLAGKAGVATPSVLVVQNKEPNAYTCGYKDESYIVVHDSILNLLTDQEMEGVLAHEMSHLKNRDTYTTVLTNRLGSITAVFSKYVGLGMVIAGFAMLTAIGGSGGKGNGGAILLLVAAFGLALMLIGAVLCVFYPVAAVIKLAISRDREYHADEGAALLTHRPLALAGALEKLQNYHAPDKELSSKYSDSMIVCHASDRFFVERMLRTHPPMESRIKRLESIDEKMRREGVDTSLRDPYVSDRLESMLSDYIDREDFRVQLAAECSGLMAQYRAAFDELLSSMDIRHARTLIADAKSNPDKAAVVSAIYYYGCKEIIAVSYDKAFEYGLYAAKNGSEMSFMMVGCMYAAGQGTSADVRKALYWLDRSSRTKFSPRMTLMIDGKRIEVI